MTRRIGLFGGSFDPVHTGHEALARVALDHLRLDRLLWIPAGQAYQKARALTRPVHRAAMLELVLAGEPRYALERSELDRPGPSYTLDTVRALQAADAGPATATWFLVLGQDQYANLHTWHGWQELLQRVTPAVASRDGAAPGPHAALAAVRHDLVVLPLPAVPVSSSSVRMRLARGEPAASLVPGLLSEAVADYIARHHLYTTAHSPTNTHR